VAALAIGLMGSQAPPQVLFQSDIFLQTKIKMALTICHILRLKCSKIDFFQLMLGELTALPYTYSYSRFKGLYLAYKGGEGRKGT